MSSVVVKRVLDIFVILMMYVLIKLLNNNVNCYFQL
jgi:hypothetical protein